MYDDDLIELTDDQLRFYYLARLAQLGDRWAADELTDVIERLVQGDRDGV